MAKPPNFAPAYVAMFPALAQIAQAHGYALAVHGSLANDYDLVAIPWTDEAHDPTPMINAFSQRLRLLYGEFGTKIIGPTDKPHGRRAWLLMIGNGAALDLSVMPMQPQDAARDREDAERYLTDMLGAAREIFACPELDEIACHGSHAPCEHALGLLKRVVAAIDAARGAGGGGE